MGKSSRAIFALLFCFAAITMVATTQQGAAGDQMQAQRQTPSPSYINGNTQIDVLVTDKTGKAIPGLEQKDFTLLDNGQPASILSFHAVDATLPSANSPVQVILLMDLVNLNFQQVAYARQEADRFFHSNGGKLAHPVSLYVFTDKGLRSWPLPFVDGDKLAAELQSVDGQLRAISQSQGVNGGMERFNMSIQALGSIAQLEAPKPGKKLLIWIGAGWPMFDTRRYNNADKTQQAIFATIVQLSTLLRQAQISLYSISAGMQSSRVFEEFLKGVNRESQANPSNLALKVIAIQSGGRVLGPNSDLAGQIASCVRDGDAFYTITFNAPRADRVNEYHDLKVVVDKPGLKALTNTGYYDQP